MGLGGGSRNKHLDCSKTPWNFMKLHEEATMKEQSCIEAKRTALAGRRFYKFQAPGEQVILSGSSSAPYLNGVEGEVMSRYADENGYLRVRMPKWARQCCCMLAN